MNNTQYHLASRKFAEAEPQRVRALLDEVGAADRWARALRRASYGVQPIDDAALAYQQQIADTFSTLKLIPRTIDITARALASSIGRRSHRNRAGQSADASTG